MSILIFVLMLCSFVGVADAQTPQAMEFTNLSWAYEVNGWNDYVPNESGTFAQGERAYAYLELTGYSSPFVEGKGHHTDLSVDVILKTKGGFITLFQQKDLVEYVDYAKHPPENVWFYIWVDIPSWAPRATYRAEVVVRDRNSGKEVREAQEIVVK